MLLDIMAQPEENADSDTDEKCGENCLKHFDGHPDFSFAATYSVKFHFDFQGIGLFYLYVLYTTIGQGQGVQVLNQASQSLQ